MAYEKLEKLTINQIKKRNKEADKGVMASIILFLVCFTLLYIIKPDLLGVSITILAPVIILFRERKKIIEVLMDRIEKLEEEK